MEIVIIAFFILLIMLSLCYFFHVEMRELREYYRKLDTMYENKISEEALDNVIDLTKYKE